MACVAVMCVSVHFADTVAISACIGLRVINVPGHSSPVTTFNPNVDGSCPELSRTECQALDLVGPGAHNLDQVLEGDTVVAHLHGT